MKYVGFIAHDSCKTLAYHIVIQLDLQFAFQRGKRKQMEQKVVF